MPREKTKKKAVIKKLTGREQRFCKLYVEDHGAFHSDLAKRSGYSEHSASTIANELLRKEHIQAEIKRLRDEKENALAYDSRDFDRDNMIEGYRNAALYHTAGEKYLDPDTGLPDITKMKRDGIPIDEVHIKRQTKEDLKRGVIETFEEIKIKAIPYKEATDMLAKLQGLYHGQYEQRDGQVWLEVARKISFLKRDMQAGRQISIEDWIFFIAENAELIFASAARAKFFMPVLKLMGDFIEQEQMIKFHRLNSIDLKRYHEAIEAGVKSIAGAHPKDADAMEAETRRFFDSVEHMLPGVEIDITPRTRVIEKKAAKKKAKKRTGKKKPPVEDPGAQPVESAPVPQPLVLPPPDQTP